MVDSKDKLRQCTGFQWDEGNATKNWEKHNVSQVDCEQLFFNRPLIIKHDKAHSCEEIRYYALGKTDGARLLFLVFTIRDQRIRVISARNMSPKEQKRYGQ